MKKSMLIEKNKNYGNNKRGVTMLVLIVAITVMLIIVSSASVVGSRAIASANFEEYTSQIARVSNHVNEYFVEKATLPVTTEVLSQVSLGNEFMVSLKDKGDIESSLFVVDIAKLGDSTIKKGRGSVTSKDVFVVAENTNNVYYLKGFKYRGKVFFSN